MDFRLQVFRTVAQELSFTKASKLLFISQPAVTKHVNELEKSFGRALFNRHGNSISLTPEGMVCYEYATKIIHLYEKLESEFADLNGNLPTRINLAASTTIAQYILPSLLAKFKGIHPETAVTLINQNSEKIESLVLEKRAHLGMVEGDSNNPLLHYEPFIKDEIVLTTGLENPILRSAAFSMHDLYSLPMVLREKGSGTRAILENVLHQKGIDINKFNVQMELGSTESIKNYLLNSSSFAFLSVHAITKELKNRTLAIVDVLDFEILRTFQFVGLHGDYDATSEWLKNFLRNHYNLRE